MCAHRIFFIHSSADGPLGCFRVLAVVNSAAGNIGVPVSFQVEVFLDMCPEVRLLDHMATPLLSRIWILFYIVAALCKTRITFPPTVLEAPLSPYLSSILFVDFFFFNYFSGCASLLRAGFV